MGPRRRSEPDPTSHIGILDDAEGRPAKRRRAREADADGLDLDSIW